MADTSGVRSTKVLPTLHVTQSIDCCRCCSKSYWLFSLLLPSFFAFWLVKRFQVLHCLTTPTWQTYTWTRGVEYYHVTELSYSWAVYNRFLTWKGWYIFVNGVEVHNHCSEIIKFTFFLTGLDSSCHGFLCLYDSVLGASMEENHPEAGREVTVLLEGEKIAEKWWHESKLMWQIAGPAMLTAVTQFSIDVVTAAFVGHLGNIELAAVSVVQNIVEGFVYGVMLGMGSALETLCGQAVGAGQFNMLGIYLQRSWIITGVTALFLTPFYIFTSPLLKLLHQNDEISDLAGKYCRWVIPQLFAYALNFPVQKFLQAQGKVWFMTIASIASLGIHVLLNWVLVTKFGHGLLGAAIAGNISWWLLNLAQIIYVISGYFPEAWTGFSLLAFKSLTGFVKLSLASAVMLCLELWYYTAVILMVGSLKNPTIAVDAVSICMNLQLWTLMIALGFNAAVSVRVSNELGAGNPKAAKFSIVVTVWTSLMFGTLFTAVILGTKNNYPSLFTSEPLVMSEASKLGYFLAATIFLNSIQPILHGVAVGAGWQFMVALLNTGCYYIVGLPIGGVLGYVFKLGVKGIWSGMLFGSVLQTVILLFIIIRTSWSKEASQAEERVKTWGGSPEHQQTQELTDYRGSSRNILPITAE